MKKDALLEIGVEPLPARFVPSALEQLSLGLESLLKENRLTFSSVRSLGTPRRLAVLVEGLPRESESLVEEVLGPPARFLKEDDGKFSSKAAGFARAHGVRPEDLKVKTSQRGEVLAVEKTIPGRNTQKLLSEIFSRLIFSLQFPKSMVWEESRFRFARPIRNIAAMLGDRSIPVTIAGVRSGKRALGFMRLASKPILIPEPSRYVSVLRNHCILVDQAQRREALSRSLDQAAKKTGFVLEKDPDLVDEVTFLTEHPVPLVGEFSRNFLELPHELIKSVLKKQLKFFPLLDKSGKVQQFFIGVRDRTSEHQKEVRRGYERVVEARLDDAAFYLKRDKRTSLSDKRLKLRDITFHERLGSLYDKSERVVRLSDWLCRRIPEGIDISVPVVRRMSELCYADLASEVVGEFPELQGVVGGEYARREGEEEKVAPGLEQFYYPLSANSPLPGSLEACLVSLAGKLDTLAGDFSVGIIPSGSEDPHGLRRQALGVVRILLERNIPVSLTEAIDISLQNQPAGLSQQERKSSAEKLGLFSWQRAQWLWETAGFKFDEIRAIRGNALENLPRAFKKLQALHAIRSRSEFESLALAFKRASNILKQASHDAADGREVDVSLLAEEAEKRLYENLQRLQDETLPKLKGGDYGESLALMVGLKPFVDGFFDSVMVMVEDERLRLNRLSLLARLVRLFKSVADLSQLQ